MNREKFLSSRLIYREKDKKEKRREMKWQRPEDDSNDTHLGCGFRFIRVHRTYYIGHTGIPA